MSFVLLPWVADIPWKMQSILLSGLRAPDAKTVAVKQVIRWLRPLCQNNADPTKDYMSASTAKYMHRILGLDKPEAKAMRETEFIDNIMAELEYLPCHYVHHFADALRVISLYFKDTADSRRDCATGLENIGELWRPSADTLEVRRFAHRIHAEVASEIFHFHIETDAEFVYRHRDKVEHE